VIDKYNAIWLGPDAPADYVNVSLDFINTPDTRLSSEHYHKYKVINFTEACISDFPKWPFILDELFKLSDSESEFVIKFNTLSSTFSVPKFYKQIHHLSNGTVELLSLENSDVAGIYILNFKASRRAYSSNRSWSFGIVWDGKNENHLESYVRSVEKQIKYNSEIELIICGPAPSFEINFDHCVISSDEHTEKYANISRKKNKIIKKAKYENICIAHNRYQLDDNFIKSFDRIKHDFDVCVVKQVLSETGERVPDWVSQASDQKLTANYLLSYGDYSPYMYVPGGLVIAKRDILLENLFNDLGTWNMAEDVELSQRLMAKDYVPRLNSRCITKVLQLRKEIIADFITPDITNFYRNIDQFSSGTTNHYNHKSFIYRNLLQLYRDPVAFLRKIKRKLKG